MQLGLMKFFKIYDHYLQIYWILKIFTEILRDLENVMFLRYFTNFFQGSFRVSFLQSSEFEFFKSLQDSMRIFGISVDYFRFIETSQTFGYNFSSNEA